LLIKGRHLTILSHPFHLDFLEISRFRKLFHLLSHSLNPVVNPLVLRQLYKSSKGMFSVIYLSKKNARPFKVNLKAKNV